MAGVARFSFAAITHPGSAKQSNEDCVAAGSWVAEKAIAASKALEGALERPFACVVADGLGGHAAGERASRFAAQRLLDLLEGGPQPDLVAAIRKTNAELFALMQEDVHATGMGTTVVGLAADREEVRIFNVGDSRAYRIEATGLRQLSTDDSSDGNWKPGSLFARTGYLTQCLGGSGQFTEIYPHVLAEPAVPGATYLLCTDGLYETLDEEQILQLVQPDLAAAANEILRVALRHFSADNLTIALVRLG